MKRSAFLALLACALLVACGSGDNDDGDANADDDVADDDTDDDSDDDADDDTFPPLDDDDASDIEYWPVDPAPQTDMAAWFDARTALLERSLYFSYFNALEGYPGRGALGDFGIGNGRIFALQGMNRDINALTEYTGPYYQNDGGRFGDTPARLFVGNEAATPGHQWIWRVRGAAINVTKTMSADETLELYTVDFAPPDLDAVARMLIVRNAHETLTFEQVAVRQAPVRDGDDAIETSEGCVIQRRGEKALHMCGAQDDADIAPEVGDLVVSWPSLAPGEEATALIAFVFVTEDNEAAASMIREEIRDRGIDALLDDTLAWWRDYLDVAAKIDVPDPKVADLYEGMQVTIGALTDQSGAVTPMSRYSSAWLRDTDGPTRFYDRIGRFDDSARMMDYVYRVGVLHHEIANSMPLDLDVSGVADPADGRTFWESCSFMPGRYKAEAPSFVPVMYHRHWLATGSTELIDARYEYLRAALTLQERTPDDLMGFSGDETFRYPLMVAMLEIQEVQENYYSLYSNLLMVVASEMMSRIADATDRDEDVDPFAETADDVRAATEANYRFGDRYAPVLAIDDLEPWNFPFEDVSTQPVWLEYLDPTSDDAAETVQDYVDFLQRDDGTLLFPEALFGFASTPFYTGMVPGFHLYNVARVDHPNGDLVFNAIDRTASDSGNYSEMQTRNHNMFTVTHAKSGRGLEEITSRYRPWEGGINLDAVLEFLFGTHVDVPAKTMRFFPHLPNRWTSSGMRDLPAGTDGAYDLRVERSGDTWSLTIESRSPHDFVAEVTFADDGAHAVTATVNDAAHANVDTIERWGRTRAILRNVAVSANSTTRVVATFSPN
ncbi:MAG: hypothetical protein IT350_09440 [Deltaproteobacteria bacterium]|nr:hypothetical protein [Deltaproteobacteria bacterium]